MAEITHSRHSVGGSNYHLQFTPKYRRGVFKDDQIRAECKRLAYEKAVQLKLDIGAIEFGPDHMHMFVTGCRKYSVPKLAQYFKGYISRHIRMNLPDNLKPYLWGDSFWTDGYFYESIGRVTADSVKFYIERQQKKHWVGVDYEIYAEGVGKKQKKLEDFFAS